MKKPIFVKEHVRESQNVTVKAHFRTSKAKTPEEIEKVSLELMDYIFQNDLEGVKRAVEAGADIHFKDDDPIIHSSMSENHEITLYLLKNVKNMSAMDIQNAYKTVIKDLPNFFKRALLTHFL
jgi:hypothetical protein